MNLIYHFVFYNLAFLREAQQCQAPVNGSSNYEIVVVLKPSYMLEYPYCSDFQVEWK